MAIWVHYKSIQPIKTGQYKCKTADWEDFVAIYVTTFGGEKKWITPKNVEYRYHEPKWCCKDCGGSFAEEPITCICLPQKEQNTQIVNKKEFVFHREEGFYVIELIDNKDAIKNALCNEGTLKVTDIGQNLIWTKKICERFCKLQGESFESTRDGTWDCDAHMAEGRVFECPYKSLEERVKKGKESYLGVCADFKQI